MGCGLEKGCGDMDEGKQGTREENTTCFYDYWHPTV
jgi:hypothetical protein